MAWKSVKLAWECRACCARLSQLQQCLAEDLGPFEVVEFVHPLRAGISLVPGFVFDEELGEKVLGCGFINP